MSIQKNNVSKTRQRKRMSQHAIIQQLESRQLLSTTPTLGAYTPQQLATAYGVNALGAANEGQGITIGIVDEYNDTGITTDVNGYSSYYGLPKMDGVGGDPTLTVDLDTTLGSVGSASGTGVGGETSLDVEMVHAMAPKANILLVEVPASGSYANQFAQLLQGVQAAAAAGADSVSLSYGIGESSIGNSATVNAQSTTYLSTGAASNIAVAVSTGDSGSPSYPATSSSVVAVGGTSLYLASAKGSYSFETAWGGLSGAGAGGGGLSTDFASPTYQSGYGVSYSKRAIPDVSLDADPVTAVSIYDSFDEGTASPWTSTGGTSVASPLFNGLMGLVQQNRVASSLAPLSSVQVDTAMYSLYDSSSYSTYFHDITLGNNKDVGGAAGFSAATGYDEATGIGSPIASALVPYLSTYSYVAAPVVKTIHAVGIGSVSIGGSLSSATILGVSSSSDNSGGTIFDSIDAKSWTANGSTNVGSPVLGGSNSFVQQTSIGQTSIGQTSIGESLPISESTQISEIYKLYGSSSDSIYSYEIPTGSASI